MPERNFRIVYARFLAMAFACTLFVEFFHKIEVHWLNKSDTKKEKTYFEKTHQENCYCIFRGLNLLFAYKTSSFNIEKRIYLIVESLTTSRPSAKAFLNDKPGRSPPCFTFLG